MARKRWAVVLGVLALFAAQPSARADDTYSIKLKEDAAGDVIAAEQSLTLTVALTLEDADGKPLRASTDKSGQTVVSTDTILTREAGKPVTRLSRHYDKVEVRRGDKTTTAPYEGKTVLIEKIDGKYHFQTEGEELSGAEAAGLEKEFNQNPEGERRDFARLSLPGKAVALNASWMIDMAPVIKRLKKMTPFETDPNRVKGTGTLRKVYTKGDRQYGVWHLDMEMPVKSFGEDPHKLVLDEDAKIAATADVDACIDGSVEDETFKLEMKIDGSATRLSADGGKAAKLAITIRGDATITQKEQPKK